VVGQCAKGTGSEAASVAGDGKLDRLKSWNGFPVRGMSDPGEGQLIDIVQLLCRQGPGGTVLDNDRLWMRLDDRAAAKWVLFPIMQCKGLGIFSLIFGNLRIARDNQAAL